MKVKKKHKKKDFLHLKQVKIETNKTLPVAVLTLQHLHTYRFILTLLLSVE